MNEQIKNYIKVGAAIACIAVGLFVVVRAIRGDRPSSGQLKSIFASLSVEDLKERRVIMAAQIAEAKASSSPNARSDLLAKAEKSLAELDALLREKGVEPEMIKPNEITAISDR